MAKPPPKQDLLLEEWKDARISVRGFDGHLLNLRRYGFTLATILLGADAYISMSTDINTVAKAGAAVAVMLLILALFLLDKHIQTLQDTALSRAAEIEDELGLGLCKLRQTATHKWQGTHSCTPIYILFLLVTGGLGSASVITTPAAEIVSFLAFKVSPVIIVILICLALCTSLACYDRWVNRWVNKRLAKMYPDQQQTSRAPKKR